MNNPMKILIMGLPGAGKTTLAKELHSKIDSVWINADNVRKKANDWDFTIEGRKRQAKRMKDLANQALKEKKHVIVDFICPTPQTRSDFNADFIIWMDTIKEGRFEDTHQMFIKPIKYDFRVTEKNAELISIQIVEKIKGRVVQW